MTHEYKKGELTARAGVFAVIDNISYRVGNVAAPHFKRIKLPMHVVYSLGIDDEGRDAITFIAPDRDWKPGMKSPATEQTDKNTQPPPTPPKEPSTAQTVAVVTATEEKSVDVDVEQEVSLTIPGTLTIGVTVNLQNFENLRVEFSGEVKTVRDVERVKGQVEFVVGMFGQTDFNTKRYVDHFVKRVFTPPSDPDEIPPTGLRSTDSREPDMSGVAYDTENTEPPI